jgi:hypothetical protein
MWGKMEAYLEGAEKPGGKVPNGIPPAVLKLLSDYKALSAKAG